MKNYFIKKGISAKLIAIVLAITLAIPSMALLAPLMKAQEENAGQETQVVTEGQEEETQATAGEGECTYDVAVLGPYDENGKPLNNKAYPGQKITYKLAYTSISTNPEIYYPGKGYDAGNAYWSIAGGFGVSNELAPTSANIKPQAQYRLPTTSEGTGSYYKTNEIPGRESQIPGYIVYKMAYTDTGAVLRDDAVGLEEVFYDFTITVPGDLEPGTVITNPTKVDMVDTPDRFFNEMISSYTYIDGEMQFDQFAIYPGSITQSESLTIVAAPQQEEIKAAKIDNTSPEVGSELTATAYNASDMPLTDDGTLVYEWYRDDAKIAGATSATYTVTNADINKQLSVKITAPQDTEDFKASSATSDKTNPVPDPYDIGKYTPGCDGTAAVGNELTATKGDLPVNATVDYKWYADGTERSTGEKLTLGVNDVNKEITLKAVGKGSYSGTSKTYTVGNVVSTQISGTVSITNDHSHTTPQVGDKLTADISGITPADAQNHLEYKWEIDGSSAVITNNLVVTAAYLTKQIKLTVSAASTQQGYTGELSETTGPVVPTPLEGTVSLGSKVAIYGDTIEPEFTGNIGEIANAEGLKYQWFDGDTAITGATERTFKVENEINDTLKVQVTGDDVKGYIGQETSEGLEITDEITVDGITIKNEVNNDNRTILIKMEQGKTDIPRAITSPRGTAFDINVIGDGTQPIGSAADYKLHEDSQADTIKVNAFGTAGMNLQLNVPNNINVIEEGTFDASNIAYMKTADVDTLIEVATEIESNDDLIGLRDVQKAASFTEAQHFDISTMNNAKLLLAGIEDATNDNIYFMQGERIDSTSKEYIPASTIEAKEFKPDSEHQVTIGTFGLELGQTEVEKANYTGDEFTIGLSKETKSTNVEDYLIFTVHNNENKTIEPASVTENGITFKTNEFSPFAIGVKASVPGDDDNNDANDEDGSGSDAGTGDNTMNTLIPIIILAILATGAIIFIVVKRRSQSTK